MPKKTMPKKTMSKKKRLKKRSPDKDGPNKKRVSDAAGGSGEILEFCGETFALGERRTCQLQVSESYSGYPVSIPIHVWRGPKPGPIGFLSGALHGDELSGTGVVRSLIVDPNFELERGTLLLCPVLNILGFERLDRYLPDRRDLNRCFPGSATGSLSSRYAHQIFAEIVERSDFGLDFHTGAVRRTNYPNVRADLERPEVASIARAFGCELLVNSKGPQGSLRREGCAAGHPTVIMEAGEVWKIEPSYIEVARRGIRNVLIHLGMTSGKPVRSPYQAEVDRSRWLRSPSGGLLQFHVAPGDVVDRKQPIATCSDLLGTEQSVLLAPSSGVVMGMTTLPAVKPGDPVCHLAIPRAGVRKIRAALEEASSESLEERVRGDLASNVHVQDVPSE